MSSCKTCGAPLPQNSNLCIYCGARNDVDLKSIHEFTLSTPRTPRQCPHCRCDLQVLNMNIDGPFYIDRCERCLGIFFDNGELHYLLEKSVLNVYDVQFKKLSDMVKRPLNGEEKVKYISCPVCHELMNRVNFGTRSGVVIDSCKEHGVWLDAGELRRLMEWKKAGGQILHEQRKQEMKLAEQKEQQRKRTEIFYEELKLGRNNSSAQPRSSQWGLAEVAVNLLFRWLE